MSRLPFDETIYNAVSDHDARLESLQRRRHPVWRLVAASIWDFLILVREARFALSGFALVTAVSVLYLLYGYNDYANSGVRQFSIFSALYETMRMMALETDLPIPEDDILGEILFFMVPLLGLALIFQSILNFGRLLLDKGSRREAWQISLARTFRNHIIICGLGSVSYRVILELLEAGYDVVAIDPDWNGEFVETILALKVPVIQGDARNRLVLRAAGVRRARSLIAGTHADLLNIEIALAARRKRPDLTVVLRIFSDELDTNLERNFGPNSAFSASALAAPTLAAAAMGRSIAQVLPLPAGFTATSGGSGAMGVLQLSIMPDSRLIGLVHVVEDGCNIRVLRHLNPQGRVKYPARRRNAAQPRRLERGDIVVLLGSLDALEQARLLNHGGDGAETTPLRPFSLAPLPGQSDSFDTVIVCGLGRIGYRVVKSLHALHPRPQIVVVCKSETTPGPFVEEVQTLGARLVYGDARRIEVLHAAAIDRACAVVAATSDDLLNVQIGLTARRLHPDIDLVLRVLSDALAERLTILFGVHTTFSVSALAAPTLAAAAVVRGIDYAIEIAEHILSTIPLEVQPGDIFAGQTVGQVRERRAILVIALRRDGAALLPLRLETRLEVGDQIVALGDITRLDSLSSQQSLATRPALAP